MEIKKSLRKTLSLSVDRTWKLIVKAPYFVSKKTIEDFIERNKNWIEEKTKNIISNIKKFNEWEKFYFFWEEYELKYSDKYKKIYFDWINFFINSDFKNESKLLFENFYKKEAKKYISKRLDEISKIYNLYYNKLSITSAKTRWGSCTSKKNINFSYRLIMAPIKTIDYVIVHELAHLKHMNHSKIFRQEVEFMMNSLYVWDYKIYKNWLKKFWNNLIF